MDPIFRGLSASTDGIQLENVFEDQNLINVPRFCNVYSDQELENGNSRENDYNGGQCLPIDSLSSRDDEDSDFPDAVLGYINRVLMEEDMEDESCMLQESLELQAKERSFYEVLRQKYPPSRDRGYIGQNGVNQEDSFFGNDGLFYEVLGEKYPLLCDTSRGYNGQNGETREDLFSRNHCDSDSGDYLVDYDFLLTDEKPIRNVELSTIDKSEYPLTRLTGRSSCCSDVFEETRSRKQAAICIDSPVRTEEFDVILLNSIGKGEAELRAYRTKLQEATRSKTQGKKRNGKKEVIDLTTLLFNCAQAAASNDHRNASELLKKIRQHSSPFGDGNQRLAHWFADGLEARLAGMGSQIYKGLMSKVGSASDYLKAYHLYLASCPFRKISNFASNKTTMMKAKNASRVHVVDFGILYGFQWPILIQRLAAREGGPPKLRITGIDFPQPGFRPAERIEETGRRLADYARTFNVPFEYNAIAKNWELIKIDDLNIDKDELLIVNSVYHFKNLHDETDRARTVVLNLIREMKPDVFIHGVVNGAYSPPYFVTRFREAMFHFSSLFDMLDVNVPRDIPERMLIEREIFGREAMNVIACEGRERVERPETYKQWQVLHLRAGFTQVPFESCLINKAIHKVRSSYHKDFLIDEDGQWMLLGWKGRIIYALSCWKPV